MPIFLRLDQAIYNWQAQHGERMTYAELARRTGIALPTLYRMKAGQLAHPDMRKINAICKILECDPGDVLQRVDTQELSGRAVQETPEPGTEDEGE